MSALQESTMPENPEIKAKARAFAESLRGCTVGEAMKIHEEIGRLIGNGIYDRMQALPLELPATDPKAA